MNVHILDPVDDDLGIDGRVILVAAGLEHRSLSIERTKPKVFDLERAGRSFDLGREIDRHGFTLFG